MKTCDVRLGLMPVGVDVEGLGFMAVVVKPVTFEWGQIGLLEH